MRERFTWLLTFGCVLCVLNVNWCQAADDDEHVHIKVRMPDMVRKSPKAHKSSPPHHHYNYYQLQTPHYYKVQRSKVPKQAVKHKRRAVKPPKAHPLPPPPRPPPPLQTQQHLMTHNHLDMGAYGQNEINGHFAGVAGGFEAVGSYHGGASNGAANPFLYTTNLVHKMPAQMPPPKLTPNYGPALFGNPEDDEGGGSSSNSYSNSYNNNNDSGEPPTTTTFLTMPGSSQKLMQHVELMGALAQAAAQAAAASGETDDIGDGGEETQKDVSATDGMGGDKYRLMANDLLAELQRTAAFHRQREEKKYRVGGLSEIGDAAAETYAINIPQQQQLLRQQYNQQQKQQQRQRQKQQQQQRPQQFYGVNYITHQPKRKPQVLRYNAPTSHNSNNNNPYYMHYKNKYQNNNNLAYESATPNEDQSAGSEDLDMAAESVVDDDDGAEDEGGGDDAEVDSVPLFFSRHPTTTTTTASLPVATSPLSLKATSSYNSIVAGDYDDAMEEDPRKFVYKSNNKNNQNYHNDYSYKHENVGEGVNPFSYQALEATAYGSAQIEEPMEPTTTTTAALSHFKLNRPYRQAYKQQQQKQKYQTYNTLKPPSGFSSQLQLQQQQLQLQPHQFQQYQQHNQLITTAQPINVVGPTASDFDFNEELQQQQQQQREEQKYRAALPRYKKHKNRIKATLNRNRIPAQ